MKITQRLLFLMLVALPLAAAAAPDYLVTLVPKASAEDAEQLEARLRVLSVETGDGTVVRSRNAARWTANLSKPAAEEIAKLPQVATVYRDVQFETTSPPVRTADNVNRVIMFDGDFHPDMRATMVSTIKKWSRETGNGYVRIVSDDVVVANLSSKAKHDVAASRGVLAVEDERGSSIPSPCDPTLDDRKD